MKAKALRGIDVFWWIAAFFLITISVDVYFVVRAVNTFPGEQVRNSYVLGLDYNQQIVRREAQKQLGWTAEAGMVDGAEQNLVVRIGSPAGAVSGLAVRVEIVAPGRRAVSVDLTEKAAGEYVATVATADTRRIDLLISATRAGGADPVFEATKMIERPS
jgi:nitrogen fixation protein FixH